MSFVIDSVRCHVEMGKESAVWNVVEEEANVMLTPNHKPQQAVILVPALCGMLATGIR